MARKPAAELGRRMMTILERGEYEVGGRTVSIALELDRAVEGTIEFDLDACIAPVSPGSASTRIEVTREATLEAAQRLHGEGLPPCALNFASARNPGGGFLSGARAQEESLARSSGLYACLSHRRMYEHHRERRDPLYSHWVIYSPAVPVVSDDDGALLDPFYLCSFLTSPACNAGVARERGGHAAQGGVRRAVEAAMRERVRRVLGVAAAQGERALVLGAWGCGVFGNEPAMVAGLFGEALEGSFAGVFERVVFAVLDWSPERRFVGPFEERFRGP